MERMIKKIEAMRDLEDDWDSYGGIAPNDKAIDKAIEFVRGLLDDPCIGPTCNGQVCIEGNGWSITIGSSDADDEFWIGEADQ